ncbi:carbohydrate kinase family protein [Solimonas marina]|uniref:Carbohydrate kinase family protein n=1 Tax=Solimonas marina TaxID=2714601 RepID=A0A969WBH2_9GAMM|nr:carbohydrate kinase family protein [Solimonas marina]NKF22411.1 carbohydrate kinase family protein [Solimonas marina]
MSALICGSVAYDTIMVYSGQFKDAILPDKVHILNVSFLVPEMRREFGGCGGNIAYSLRLLGEAGQLMATVGDDFANYAEWMDQHGIARDTVRVMPGSLTAHGHVVTDLDDNQIWAFHPGAMSLAQQQDIVTEGVRFGIISPDSRDGMLLHAKQFAEAGIPFIFDPGQGLPMFNGDELRDFIDKAAYLTVNDYECELLMQRTGLNVQQLAAQLDALIVTHGGKGSQIHTGGQIIEVPCAKADSLTDPTGCGDAYRGGLLYGLLRGLDWETTGRVASLMGTYCVERPGTQNHRFTIDQFRARYKKAFRAELP